MQNDNDNDLYANVGLETATGVIGLEYIARSATNTTLYGITRSATNKLAPDTASDTYVNLSGGNVTKTVLRAAFSRIQREQSKKRNIVILLSPGQASKICESEDVGQKRKCAGFKTELWLDAVPMFEVMNFPNTTLFVLDITEHKIGILIPPTLCISEESNGTLKLLDY